MSVGTVGTLKAIFAGPIFAIASQGVLDARGHAGAIFGMNLFLSKTDVVCGVRSTMAEQALKALRPGKCARSYIPIPNSIIRRPGNNRRMFLVFSQTVFRGV